MTQLPKEVKTYVFTQRLVLIIHRLIHKIQNCIYQLANGGINCGIPVQWNTTQQEKEMNYCIWSNMEKSKIVMLSE